MGLERKLLWADSLPRSRTGTCRAARGTMNIFSIVRRRSPEFYFASAPFKARSFSAEAALHNPTQKENILSCPPDCTIYFGARLCYGRQPRPMKTRDSYEPMSEESSCARRAAGGGCPHTHPVPIQPIGIQTILIHLSAYKLPRAAHTRFRRNVFLPPV